MASPPLLLIDPTKQYKSSAVILWMSPGRTTFAIPSDRSETFKNSFEYTMIETESGHPGQLGHILSGSSMSDLVYKISGSDLYSAFNHMH